MSKVPPSEQRPFSSHRSISVREQRGLHSPGLQRSATAHNRSSQQEAAPVEIGSKGSIFSLVGRDTSAISTHQVVDSAKRASADATARQTYHIWHNRLWLVLPTAGKKQNGAEQSSDKASKLTLKRPTVAESEKEDSVPTWKRVLRKLKEGYKYSKSKNKRKNKGETPPQQTEKMNVNILGTSIHMRETARRVGFVDLHNAEGDPMNPPCMPLQTKPSPMNTIWERRTVAQINPLDLSHLHTPRLKKAYNRPQVPLS
ncbi:hypothetical protein L7F22_013428 [Adiantum nelumboides]|nr:hypothetical protein [Adiantum nelumboides]